MDLRRSRVLRWAAPLATVSLGLAGCGGDDESPDTTTAVTTATVTTTTVPPTTTTSTTTTTTTTTTTSTTTTTTTSTTVPPPPPPTLADLIARGNVNIAHTGGELENPDETVFGFRQALASGADVLDLNVLLSKDGQLVLLHNPTVENVSNGTGAVAEMTAAELFELDAAYWFVPGAGRPKDRPEADYVYRGVRTGDKPPPEGASPDDFGVPTLELVFQTFPDAVFGIEMQEEAGPAVAPALAALIEEYGMQERVLVSSMGDALIEAFRALLPDVAVSPGINTMLAWYGAPGPLPGYAVLQLPPKFGEIDVFTPELLAAAEAAGIPIWVWSNNKALETLEDYRHWLDLGMNGVIVDRPSVMAELEDYVPA